MSSIIASQSATNWRLLKQIYLQGARPPAPPEPAPHDSADQSFMQHTASLLTKMEDLYRRSVAELEQRVQQSMQFFSRRIAALEEEVIVLRGASKAISEIEPRPSPLEMVHPNEGEAAKPASFIHIEQEEEESLLDPQTVQKSSIILSPALTARKVGKSSGNVRRLFEDDSSGRMKHQSSEAMYPLSTKESAYFERDVREQMQALRCFIERAHGITLESSLCLPEVAVAVKSIEVEPSRNEVLHLRNENGVLRQQMKRFQAQLEQAQEELEKLRHLLLRGIEQHDYGPYAACL